MMQFACCGSWCISSTRCRNSKPLQIFMTTKATPILEWLFVWIRLTIFTEAKAVRFPADLSPCHQLPEWFYTIFFQCNAFFFVQHTCFADKVFCFQCDYLYALCITGGLCGNQCSICQHCPIAVCTEKDGAGFLAAWNLQNLYQWRTVAVSLFAASYGWFSLRRQTSVHGPPFRWQIQRADHLGNLRWQSFAPRIPRQQIPVLPECNRP